MPTQTNTHKIQVWNAVIFVDNIDGKSCLHAKSAGGLAPPNRVRRADVTRAIFQHVCYTTKVRVACLGGAHYTLGRCTSLDEHRTQ